MFTFAGRNLKMYFRDRSAVFFSLLAVFIQIGLYVLFLGDVWTESLEGFDFAREIMDNWVMAGVLATTSVTTTMGILANMVRDKSEKIIKDFYVSPVSKVSLTGGYWISAYVVALIMSFLALIIAEIYICCNGGALMGAGAVAKVCAMILLVSFMNTSMVLFVVSAFKSMNAYSTASTLVGTLIGFLTGIYLPIGMYPEAVQWIIKIFPVSHGAAVFRQIMMEAPMAKAFEGAPKELVEEFNTQFGVVYEFGDYQLTAGGCIVIMAVVSVIFFGLTCVQAGKKSDR